VTFANVIWFVGLALEILCFQRLASRRVNSALTTFVCWQLLIDVLAVFVGSTPLWGTIYWMSHSITYILLLVLFMPFRIRTISGTYWLATLTLTVFAIAGMWIFEPWKQFQLAIVCGALAMFAAAVTFFTHGLWLPRATWIGIALWAGGQIASAALPKLYATIYPTTCTVAFMFFLIATRSTQIAYVEDAAPLSHVRLPLSNRYNRRVLAFLQG
jgi:hypothetical protein